MGAPQELSRRDFLRFIGSSSLLVAVGLVEFPSSADGSGRGQHVPRLAHLAELLRDKLGPAGTLAGSMAEIPFTTKIQLNANPLVYIGLPVQSSIRDTGDLVRGAMVETIVAEAPVRLAGQDLPRGQYFLWIGTVDSRSLSKEELDTEFAGTPLRDEVRSDGLLVVDALIDVDGQIRVVDPWLHQRVRNAVEGGDAQNGWMDEQLFELSPIALLTRCPSEQKPLGNLNLYSLGSQGGRCPPADAAAVPALSPFGLGILGSAVMLVVYRFLKVRSGETRHETT